MIKSSFSFLEWTVSILPVQRCSDVLKAVALEKNTSVACITWKVGHSSLPLQSLYMLLPLAVLLEEQSTDVTRLFILLLFVQQGSCYVNFGNRFILFTPTRFCRSVLGRVSVYRAKRQFVS
jgi:hypothetical protein